MSSLTPAVHARNKDHSALLCISNATFHPPFFLILSIHVKLDLHFALEECAFPKSNRAGEQSAVSCRDGAGIHDACSPTSLLLSWLMPLHLVVTFFIIYIIAG